MRRPAVRVLAAFMLHDIIALTPSAHYAFNQSRVGIILTALLAMMSNKRQCSIRSKTMRLLRAAKVNRGPENSPIYGKHPLMGVGR